MHPKKRSSQLLPTLLGIDTRSLAVFRMALALLLLADLGIRALYLEAHYSDGGVLPRFYAQKLMSSWTFSLYMLNGAVWWQGFLFGLAAFFAVLLLIGHHSRLACFASWVMLLSLHDRNPLVLNAGDMLLRLLLFWGMFLPMGARWSWDRMKLKNNTEEEEAKPQAAIVFSVGSVALLMQVCFMYLFTGLLKQHPIWNSEFTAVSYALSLDHFATPFGKWLLQFPEFLQVLTFVTIYLELFGPLCAFLPWRFGPVRTLVATGFIGFHLLGLALCMQLGLFSWVCAVAWLPFLPAWFWERLPLAKLDWTKTAWGRSLVACLQRVPLLPAVRVHERSPVLLGMNLLAGVLLVYVLCWNVRTLNPESFRAYFPDSVNGVGRIFRVEQYWSMFAPRPFTDDGWFVVEGRLHNGQTVDLFTGHDEVRWEKPELVSALYPTQRWRKYMRRLWWPEHKRQRTPFVQYLARRWNAEQPASRQVQSVRMYFMKEETQLDNPRPPVEKVLLLALEPLTEQRQSVAVSRKD